ncbi:MAG: hypothetical protein GWN00_21170, partial [Aliifodinibius sp.]|nr:hypothetical protein [candidate division KSB1 bacterium]NIR65323.1 hypothetical protein [candidate division Zixibacteria bacterium]NIT58643.1 hypothetical protein [Fodinibius sp.]NIW46378.1 hypothetical protein [Gammaproteobacteria bacterium]NIS47038.1 hypothetical protein [candidate division Zixibacteria bacterium]
MKKYMGLGLIVLVIVLIAYRIITHGEETTIKSIDTYQQENGIPVEVQEVKRSDLIISRSFSGTIEGRDQADANTQTAQEVVSIPVQVGQFVKKGEVVARLDPDIGSNATLRYNQAKANYED